VSDGLSKISKLLEAIDYTLSHWAGLTLFLGDGRLEPDTNSWRETSGQLPLEEKTVCSGGMLAADTHGWFSRHFLIQNSMG
jgi:transposase